MKNKATYIKKCRPFREKCFREEPCFAPLREYDAPQNRNLRSAFFTTCPSFFIVSLFIELFIHFFYGTQ